MVILKQALFILLCCVVLFAKDVDSFFVDSIILRDKDKQAIKPSKKLAKIVLKYTHKKCTIKKLNQLIKDIEIYYDKLGFKFTKVIVPAQDINNNILFLDIYIPIIGKINIEGNKYYSTKFIKDKFSQKENSYLNYNNMITSLLKLNEYSNLTAKVFLKNNKKTNKTDITLKVQDKKPFNSFIKYDNLGTSTTSKNRINLGLSYGNLFLDGDLFGFQNRFSFNPNSTNLLISNYIVPINSFGTKIKLGFIHANYTASGNLVDLGIKGDTKIYNIGLLYPWIKNFTTTANFYTGYTQKQLKNYLLNQISSKEIINNYEISFDYILSSLYATNSFNIKLIFGELVGDIIKNRVNEENSFKKLTLNMVRNQIINKRSNIIFKFDSQYSKNRLSTAEMYSIGGYGSVRGFLPSVAIGDSGYTASIELINKILSNNIFKIDLGIFIDYGAVYNNNIIVGEVPFSDLLGGGIKTQININKRYSLDIYLSYPLDGTNISYENKMQIYTLFNIALW